jgi:hypothetical protein
MSNSFRGLYENVSARGKWPPRQFASVSDRRDVHENDFANPFGCALCCASLGSLYFRIPRTYGAEIYETILLADSGLEQRRQCDRPTLASLPSSFCEASDALSRTREMPKRNTSGECDGRYCPLAAGLSPSLIASASLTYLPLLVVP